MPVPPCLLGRGPTLGWGAQSRWDWGDAGTQGKAGTALFGEGSQAGCLCHLACWGAGQSRAGVWEFEFGWWLVLGRGGGKAGAALVRGDADWKVRATLACAEVTGDGWWLTLGRGGWLGRRQGRDALATVVGGARAGWTGVESGLLGVGERGKRMKGRERGVGVPWIRGLRGLLWGERVITEGLPRDRENRAATTNQPARNLT